MKPVIVPTSDVNSETAVLNAWNLPDRALVAAGEVLAQVETSKAVLDVLAPDDGYLLHAAQVGETIGLADPIAHLFDAVDELEAFARRSIPSVVAATAAGPRLTAPAARRAAELGVDPESFPGGDELVTVRMVEAAARAGHGSDAVALPDPLDAPAGAERVALIGAGLGATQVLDILGHGQQRAVAVVDDDPARWGDAVGGIPVVGGPGRLAELYAAGRFDTAIVCISTSVPARTRFRELCRQVGIPLTNAIDPTVRRCAGVQIGAGNVVCAFCHFGVGTRLGDNNFLSAYNSFDHHSVLGSDISTGPGCMTSGHVHLGDRVRLGSGIFVEPNLELGTGVQVASGAVIVGSVPAFHAVKRRVATMAVVGLRQGAAPLAPAHGMAGADGR